MISKNELLNCCQLSINAYKGRHGKIKEVLETKKEQNVNGIYLCTGWLNNNFYIVFEGTDGTDEWIENFNCYKESKYKRETPKYDTNCLKTIKVHLGFLNHYELLRDRIWGEVCEAFETIVKYDSIIYVTGHSLGGITATLCADDLQLNTKFRIKVVTFGSPRGFNALGAIDFNQRFTIENSCEAFRVIFKNDLVTKVPTTWMGFKHCGQRIWLDKMSKWEVFLHPIRRFIGNPKDHYPERYLEAIKKIKEIM